MIEHMGKLLAEIAVIVNGPEPALTRWSYHDLPDKVRALKEAPTVAPAGEAVVIGYRPMEGKATISWRGSSNPDWVKLGTKLYTHPAADALGAVRELPAKWRQRAEQKISASQHASIEQKCIARFRADDELARANELEAALAKPQSGEVS